MTAQAIPKLRTKAQAAELLGGISPATIDRLAVRGLLTPIKIGRSVRFAEATGRPHPPRSPERAAPSLTSIRNGSKPGSANQAPEE
jgi:hypothetical protein